MVQHRNGNARLAGGLSIVLALVAPAQFGRTASRLTRPRKPLRA